MSNFTKICFWKIFHVNLDVLPMITIVVSNFEQVKSYGLVYCVLYSVPLRMPLPRTKGCFTTKGRANSLCKRPKILTYDWTKG